MSRVHKSEFQKLSAEAEAMTQGQEMRLRMVREGGQAMGHHEFQIHVIHNLTVMSRMVRDLARCAASLAENLP